jgi:hypothetical protein
LTPEPRIIRPWRGAIRGVGEDYPGPMDIEAEINSLKRRMALVESEITYVQNKVDTLIQAKKVLTEVMMNLVAAANEGRDNTLS